MQKRSSIVIWLAGLALLALLWGGALAWKHRQRQRTVYTDGATIKQAMNDAIVRDVLWQPPILLPDTINTDAQEYEAHVSADGLTIYFVRGKAGENADIYSSTRASESSERWSPAHPLTAINTGDDELGPAPSPDGQSLYFYSNRAGGQGGYDLWVTRRADGGDWQSPVNLGPAVNTQFNEFGPAIAPDGSCLYFSSNRPQSGDSSQRAIGAWPTTVRENDAHRDYDLYAAAINDGQLQTAAPIQPLNSIHNEGAPCLSPAGDFLYFCSDRPGGSGGFDLYRARRLHGDFQPPMNLGPDVNSAGNELDPAVGMGGFGLHFSSDRPLESSLPDALRDYNLYHTTSREVFTQVQAGDSLLDWAVLGPLIGSTLLWLLLGLLALLLTKALLKSARSRKLSLLTRCLMVSLLAHLILMVMLTFWQVTTSLAGLMDRNSGGTRVALTSAAGGNELFTQIRGDLTQVSFSSIETAAGRESSDLATPSPQLVSLAAESHTSAFQEQPSVRAQGSEAPTQALPAPALRADTPIDSAKPIDVNVPAAGERIASAEAGPASPHATSALVPQERDALPTVAAKSAAPVALSPALSGSSAASRIDSSLASSPTAGESAPTIAELPKPLLQDAGPTDLATASIAMAMPQTQSPKRVSERAAASPPAVANSSAHAAVSAPPRSSVPATNAVLAPTKLRAQADDRSTIQPESAAIDSAIIASTDATDAGDHHIDSATGLPDTMQIEVRSPMSPPPGGKPATERELGMQVTAQAQGQPSARAVGENTVSQHPNGNQSMHIAPEKSQASSVETSRVLIDQKNPAARESLPPGSNSQDGSDADLNVLVPRADAVAESQLATPAEGRLEGGLAADGEAAIALASVPSATSRPVHENFFPHAGSSTGVHLPPSHSTATAADGPSRSIHQSLASQRTADAGIGSGAAVADSSPDISVTGVPAIVSVTMATPPEGQREKSGGGKVEESSTGPTGIEVSTKRASSNLQPVGGGPAVHLEPSTSSGASPASGVTSAVVKQLSNRTTDSPISTSVDGASPDLAIALPAIAVVDMQLPGGAEDKIAEKKGGHAEAVGSLPSIDSSAARSSHGSGGPRPLSQTTVHLTPSRDSAAATGEPLRGGKGSGGQSQPSERASDSSDRGAGLWAPSIDLEAIAIPAGIAVDVHIPTELPPANPYVQRTPEKRLETVKKMGGSEATEKAVALALKWLAAHQSADGRWAAKHFDDDCGECRGTAKFDTDIAATGLSLLCFLAADHTHFKDGPYRDQVKRGLQWLVAQQKADGDFRGNETMYSHGIATIAVSEAYGMTNDPDLLEPLKSAIQFICDSRNRRVGGWRYEPGQAGDTSVLGWQMMALVSARRLGINAPEDAFDAARLWLETVTVPTKPGLYAYQPGQRHSPSMTAEGMFVQQLLGVPHDDPKMQASVEYVLQNPPRWRGEPNTYYWYYATLALFQHQGKGWEAWNKALTEQLLDNQNLSGALAGSWDPVDNWSKIGGRIYQTAICTLSLEVYYRYLPMYAAGGINAGDGR